MKCETGKGIKMGCKRKQVEGNAGKMLRGKTWVVHFRFSSVAKNHEAIYMELQECDPNSTKAGRLKRKTQQTPARQTDAINDCRLSATEGTEGAGGRKIKTEGRKFADCLQEQQHQRITSERARKPERQRANMARKSANTSEQNKQRRGIVTALAALHQRASGPAREEEAKKIAAKLAIISGGRPQDEAGRSVGGRWRERKNTA